MSDEETRNAERLALLQRADGFLKTIEMKHDIEVGNRLRSIVVGINALVDIAEAEPARLQAELDHLKKLATPADHMKHRLDEAELQLEASAKANARLLNENEALKYENDALRCGPPKAADPIAVFEELQPPVAGLIRNMKRAKREEGGLYCGGCGVSIADNAQGVQDMRDEVVALRSTVEELLAFQDAVGALVAAKDEVNAEEALRRLSAMAEGYDDEPATGDELTAAHAKRLNDDLGWAAPEVHGAHILRAMDRLAHAVRLELEPVSTCDYCDAPFDDAGDCKCEGTPIDEIPF